MKNWQWWRTEDGSNTATNVGLPVSRVSHYSSLHRLGRRLQLLRTRDVGDDSTDRCRARQLSTDTDARRWRVAVELSFVAVQRDRDVDRVRTLGRNAGVHVHGAGVARCALARRESVLVAEQHPDECDRARWFDVVYEPEPARCELAWGVRRAGSQHDRVRWARVVRGGISS